MLFLFLNSHVHISSEIPNQCSFIENTQLNEHSFLTRCFIAWTYPIVSSDGDLWRKLSIVSGTLKLSCVAPLLKPSQSYCRACARAAVTQKHTRHRNRHRFIWDFWTGDILQCWLYHILEALLASEGEQRVIYDIRTMASICMGTSALLYNH